MRPISVGLAACLVAAAAGCGTVTASSSASAAHSAASGARVAVSGSDRMPAGCHGPGPATTAVITLAGNQRTYCLRVGGRLSVYLRSAGSSSWLLPLASSDVLVPVAGGAGSLPRGVTAAWFAAVRPGQTLVTSVEPPCQIAFLLRKGDLQPAFPVPRVYPVRSCPPGHRFSVSVMVVR